MVTENPQPQDNGRSKYDDDVAARIAEFRLKQAKESEQIDIPIEPLPDFKKVSKNPFNEISKFNSEGLFSSDRIEIVARDVLRDLEEIMSEMTSDELEDREQSEDVLLNFYKNDLFVRERIGPVVSDLMQKTPQLVYLTDAEYIGYCYASESDDGYVKDGIYLILESDNLEGKAAPIFEPLIMQEIWELSVTNVRDDMISFAAYSKEEIINRFYAFANYYANPATS